MKNLLKKLLLISLFTFGAIQQADAFLFQFFGQRFQGITINGIFYPAPRTFEHQLNIANDDFVWTLNLHHRNHHFVIPLAVILSSHVRINENNYRFIPHPFEGSNQQNLPMIEFLMIQRNQLNPQNYDFHCLGALFDPWPGVAGHLQRVPE